MNKRKFTALLLCIIMTLASLSFMASAEGEAYAPEVGVGYISFDFSQITGGMVNNKTTATYEKNVMFEGQKAVKFVPTPEIANNTNYTLDCYSLANYPAKVEVPKYKYVGITYYYATDKPSYNGKLNLTILPGSTKATKTLSANSTAEIVTNKWTEAFFSYSTTMKLEETEKPYIAQVHFKPFGNTNPANLTKDDVLYVAKYTFYEKNPDPNAVSSAEFIKESPDAVGEPVKLTFKEDDKYTLPENPFTNKSGVFKGWKYTIDGKIYQPGTEMTAIDGDVVYAAVWESTKENADFITLNFPDYEDGIVNKRDTGTVEVVDFDGRTVVKCVPNPLTEQSKSFTVDGYSYKGAGIDLEEYKWFAVEYKYVSENPMDCKMTIAIMTNGNVLAPGKNASRDSTEPLVEGRWAMALFDFTELPSLLNPDTEDHEMRQMHLRPLGAGDCTTFNADDAIYISRVMFFKDKPDMQTHKSYMTGYEDGNFKPNKTMSRAEACTVVARLLASEEEIAGTASFTDVAADKWYAKYIGFCESKGLLKSYSGTFEPDKAITRAEFAELVFNTELAKPSDKKASFTDVDASHPKYTAIMAAASAGLITGYEDGTFLPDRTITRAQVVTVINRARGRSMTTETISNDITVLFLDVDSSHWAFAELAEATCEHVEFDGKWLYPTVDPVKTLLTKVDVEDIISFDEGKAKVAEVDRLAAEKLASVRATESDYSTITGTKYYVSPNGDDSNDGLSEAKPFKTITKANAVVKAGDGILLERGGLWRTKFTAKQCITYTAYGKGDKPKIYGSPENGADASKWTLHYENKETGAKIWKYANESMVDVGTLVLNDGDFYAMKEIPSYDGTQYVTRDKRTPYVLEEQLDKDLEFFHKADSVVSGGVINAGTSIGPLYFRCDKGNPGEVYKSIEFNTKNNIVGIGGVKVTIDNLCIMYGGSHGIGSGTTENLTVKNCEIGWIGGSIQSYNANGSTGNNATRFGNGVEIYGGCQNYTIDNCYVYQCYDAGVTHQLSGLSSGNCEMNDITYSNNLIEKCVYSIEYFLGTSNDGNPYKRYGKNVLFENNILRLAGFGFGSFRPDGHNQRHIRSGSSRNQFENYVIKNNIFDRSVHELFQVCSQYDACVGKLEGNTYIQGYGNRLCTYGLGNGTPCNMDVTALSALKNTLKDETGKLYFVENIPYWSFPYTSFDAK